MRRGTSARWSMVFTPVQPAAPHVPRRTPSACIMPGDPMSFPFPIPACSQVVNEYPTLIKTNEKFRCYTCLYHSVQTPITMNTRGRMSYRNDDGILLTKSLLTFKMYFVIMISVISALYRCQERPDRK